jgi:hypothetical protein
MVKHLATTIEEQYYCKAVSNETIKIGQLQEEKIVHHTYQIREERAYRVVIQNLHHSIATDEIKQELENKVILSAIYKTSGIVKKITAASVFLGLEPKENNKSIYEIKYLCNMKISKLHERKTTLYSAQDVSATGIQKHIAQDHILVLNAEANTTQPCVKRIQILMVW